MASFEEFDDDEYRIDSEVQTPGPGEYSVPTTFGGPAFSFRGGSSDKRGEVAVFNGPGPGEYPKPSTHSRKGGAIPFAPRGTTIKTRSPGPKYYIPSTITSPSSKVRFGSSPQRPRLRTSPSPGPIYNLTASASTGSSFSFGSSRRAGMELRNAGVLVPHRLVKTDAATRRSPSYSFGTSRPSTAPVFHKPDRPGPGAYSPDYTGTTAASYSFRGGGASGGTHSSPAFSMGARPGDGNSKSVHRMVTPGPGSYTQKSTLSTRGGSFGGGRPRYPRWRPARLKKKKRSSKASLLTKATEAGLSARPGSERVSPANQHQTPQQQQPRRRRRRRRKGSKPRVSPTREHPQQQRRPHSAAAVPFATASV